MATPRIDAKKVHYAATLIYIDRLKLNFYFLLACIHTDCNCLNLTKLLTIILQLIKDGVWVIDAKLRHQIAASCCIIVVIVPEKVRRTISMS